VHGARVSRGIGVIDALGVVVALRRHRRIDRERPVTFQHARLRRLIAHAYESVFAVACWRNRNDSPLHTTHGPEHRVTTRQYRESDGLDQRLFG